MARRHDHARSRERPSISRRRNSSSPKGVAVDMAILDKPVAVTPSKAAVNPKGVRTDPRIG